MARAAKTSGQVYFRELQTFSQPWLYIAVAVGGIMPIVVLYVLMIQKDAINREQFFIAVPIVLVISVLSIVFLFKCSLETIITSEGIFVKWRPFHRSFLFYDWDNIKSVKLTKISSVSANGRTHQNRLTLKMMSNVAIELHLNKGKEIVIGTTKSSRLVAELSKHVEVSDHLNRKS